MFQLRYLILYETCYTIASTSDFVCSQFKQEAQNISIIQGNNIAFIKTYPGGSGYVTNVTFSNFRSLASLYGLNINQYWQNTFEPDTGSVSLSNLVFRNFSGALCFFMIL